MVDENWGPLFELVTQRPEDRLRDWGVNPECPRGCPNAKIERTEPTSMTLVGGGKQANHTWSPFRCLSCGTEFVVESKAGNTWATTSRGEGRVLCGIPSCFESYVYTCAKCGGDVLRHFTETDGETPVSCLRRTVGGDRHYRAIYRCENCRASAEPPYDYWTPGQGMSHQCKKIQVISVEDDHRGTKTITGKCVACHKRVQFTGCYLAGIGKSGLDSVRFSTDTNAFTLADPRALDADIFTTLLRWRDEIEAQRKSWTITAEDDPDRINVRVYTDDPPSNSPLLDAMTRRVQEDLNEEKE